MKFNAKATIALTAFLLTICSNFYLNYFVSAAYAQTQPSPLLPPQPVPPLSDKQKAAVQQLIQQEISASQALDDRIEEKVNNTFGWTITLINFLIAVLIAFPIVIAIVAWALRRSVIAELVNETKKQFRAEIEHEVRQQLEHQVAVELQKQIEAFKQEIENQKAFFSTQLQTSFVAAQQEKEKIFHELAKITLPAIQEEFVTPDVQKRIQAFTHQLERLKAANPQIYLTVDDYIRQGDALYLEQRFDDATLAYDQAITLQPDRVAAWIGKTRALRQLDRFEEASTASDRAIQIAPNLHLPWYSKAQALLKLQKYPEAIKALNKAIKLSPEKGNAWRLRGYVLTKLGRFSEAKACFEKAMSLLPISGDVHYSLAYYCVTQGQIEQALIYLQQAIDLQPQFRDVLRTDPDFDLLREDDRLMEIS